MSVLTRLRHLLGMDRAVSYSLALRVWNGLAMPVTLLLIARHLSLIEQGFYYSFAGVQGLAVLGELGITFVVSQFAAHEYAAMSLGTNRDAEKRRKHAARLASILKLGLMWNTATFLLCLVLLIPGGIWFFAGAKDAQGVQWLLPWICFALFGSLGIILSPVYAVLNGVGHMGDTTLIQFIQTAISTLATWSLLLCGYKLFAVVAIPMMAVIGGTAGILIMHRKTLQTILAGGNQLIKVNYWGEMFPLQSKVALSWLASYVGFYFATPLIFRTLSPQIAGQYGMTTSLLLSISATAGIWVTTKGPALAHLAAVHEIPLMRRTFISASAKSFAVLFAGYLTVIVCPNIAVLKSHLTFLSRLLSGSVLLTLIGAYTLVHLYGILNSFLRSFKDDPLFWLSISSALITVLALRGTARHYGVEGVAWLMVVCNAICCIIAIRYYLMPVGVKIKI